jgi:hypothetical protein
MPYLQGDAFDLDDFHFDLNYETEWAESLEEEEYYSDGDEPPPLANRRDYDSSFNDGISIESASYQFNTRKNNIDNITPPPVPPFQSTDIE